MRKLPLGIFLGLCVLCVIHAFYYYPQLPERMASHFGADGKPDDWSSKATFFLVYLSAIAVCAILFSGIAFGLSYLPVSMINLPNKEYWLSPERRRETYNFMRHYFLWFASATILLLFDIMHQTFQVNLGKADTLRHFWLSLGLYLGFTVLWCVGLIVRFGKRSSA